MAIEEYDDAKNPKIISGSIFEAISNGEVSQYTKHYSQLIFDYVKQLKKGDILSFRTGTYQLVKAVVEDGPIPIKNIYGPLDKAT
ncbi:hypothetical protein, partial [Escherichia coli]|uniref:hypothetical protein n=1 Tax=Escherichia coli TaxID=562 RepID=UPI00128EA7E7